jgi:hypothetical protein
MRGTVRFWKANEDGVRGFGFVGRDGFPREDNAWLGPKVLDGLIVRSGDIVDYEATNSFKDKGPRVTKIRLIEHSDDDDDSVETIGGEY